MTAEERAKRLMGPTCIETTHDLWSAPRVACTECSNREFTQVAAEIRAAEREAAERMREAAAKMVEREWAVRTRAAPTAQITDLAFMERTQRFIRALPLEES